MGGGEFRARLGYLPQDFGYYPEFTALDFMEYMAALKGLDAPARHARARSSCSTGSGSPARSAPSSGRSPGV